MRLPFLALVLPLFAPLAQPRAEVLVVAPASGPGVDATTIQQAVDEAVDGDTILVRDGTYPAFVVTGKSLALVADGANVFIQAGSRGFAPLLSVRIVSLAEDQRVVLRGFATDFGILVQDCVGPVWIDRIDVAGATTTAFLSGVAPGATVSNSSEVTFTSCSLRGDQGVPSFLAGAGQGGSGAGLFTSDVRFFDCTLLGGTGASEADEPSEGGAGLRLDGGCNVLLSGTTIAGGPGGIATNAPCTGSMASGGVGLSFNPTDTVSSLASTATGGVADLGSLCPGQVGLAGADITGTGTIVPLNGFARSLGTNSPVRGGASVTFTASGQTGELPLVLVSTRHDTQRMPALSGSLLVGLPADDVLLLPAVSSTGSSSRTLPAPNVGLTVGALSFYTQAIFVDPSGGLWLGGGSTVTLVDASL